MTEFELYTVIDKEIEELNSNRSLSVLANSIIGERVRDMHLAKILISTLVKKYSS